MEECSKEENYMKENQEGLHTAVALIIFNRPDTTSKVLEQIKKVQPPRLYLISDAPRKNRQQEAQLVKETRAYVEAQIDWDCQVFKNYAEENMGCRDRVSSGITWLFQQEEKAIILEDDVVPTREFFFYCQELLDKYQDQKDVMMISGTNLVPQPEIKDSYTFSYYSSIWGWATWRRAWELYDVEVKDWPQAHKEGRLRRIQNGLAYLFLKRNMDSVYTKKKDTWDLQWDFCRYEHSGLGIVPKVNMIENIGFNRADATHTTGNSTEDFTCGVMQLPLQHPEAIQRNMAYDKAYIKKYFGVRKVVEFIKKKLRIN